MQSVTINGTTYTEEDFSFIEESSRTCILNGLWALNQTELTNWLSSFTPMPKDGFIFSTAPELQYLSNKMEESNAPWMVGHSGASFGWTMRQLKYIINNGFDKYKELWLSKLNDQ